MNSKTEAEDKPRRLLITVHGIRTFGHWQERLEALLHEETLNTDSSQFDIYHYRFGYFSVLAFLIPPVRWLVTRRFREALERKALEHKYSRIDIVAHSFGTHLVGWGLHGVPADRRPNVHTLILAGSVLKPGFPWADLMEKSVQRVANDCGLKDKVLVLNQLVVLFTGMAGRAGFSGMTGGRFRNRFFEFGHSGYFTSPVDPDSFMRKQWIPLLLSEGEIAAVDDPRSASALRGLTTFLLNNAEPFKLTIYLVLLIGLTAPSLYSARSAQSARSQFLQGFAEIQRASGDALTALNLAWEALPHERLSMFRPFSQPAMRTLVEARYERRQIATLRSSQIWDITEEQVAETPRLWGVTSVAWSTDGRYAVAAQLDGSARLWDVEASSEVRFFVGHEVPEPSNPLINEREISSVAFSPSGQHIVTGGYDNTARIWETATGDALAVLRGHTGYVMDLAYSPDPDSRYVVTGSLDYTARLWDPQTGEQIALLAEHTSPVRSVAFSKDGTLIGAASDDGIGVWETNSRRQIAFLAGGANTLAFSSDGKKIIAGSNDNTSSIWDIASESKIVELAGHEAPVLDAIFTANDARAITASADGSIRIWNAANGTERAVLRGHAADDPLTRTHNEGSITSLAISPDGKRFLSGGYDSTVRVWSLATSPDVMILPPHWGAVSPYATDQICSSNTGSRIDSTEHVFAADFDATGTILVTGTKSPCVYVWHTTGGAQPTILGGHHAAVNHVQLANDGSVALTVDADGVVRIWATDTGTLIGTLVAGDDDPSTEWDERRVRSANLTANGTRVVTGASTNDAYIWDAVTGKLIRTLKGHEDVVFDTDIDPKGRLVVTGSQDRTARVWDADTGQELHKLEGHKWPVQEVRFSTDGSRVMTVEGSDRGLVFTVKVWNAKTGTLINDLKREGLSYSSAAFSPSGELVVISTLNDTAIVFDATKNETLFRLDGHRSVVNDAQFSSDGKQIVTASTDGTAILWDASNGTLLAVMRGHNSYVYSAKFDQAQSRVLTLSADGSARIWPIWNDNYETIRESASIIDLLRPMTGVDRCRYHLDSERLCE